MKVVDLADEIFRELDEDSSISISSITYWLENNIGQLNLLLDEEIVFETTDFSPELTIPQANIFKLLYIVKFYSSKISSNLGAAAYDWSELSEGDTTIRRVSKNEIAKNYKQLRDGVRIDVDMLTYLYKKNQIKPSSYEIYDDGYLGAGDVE